MTRWIFTCVCLAMAACGSSAATDGAASSSAPASKSAAAKSDAKPDAPASKTPTTKLVKKDVDDLLTKTFGIDRMREPADKRAQEVATKLGPPAKTDGDRNIWYAIGEPGTTCYEVKLSMKDGSYDLGQASDKSSCGL